MPDNGTEEEPSSEEPGNAVPAEGKGGQDQDGPATNRQMTFLEHVGRRWTSRTCWADS